MFLQSCDFHPFCNQKFPVQFLRTKDNEAFGVSMEFMFESVPKNIELAEN